MTIDLPVAPTRQVQVFSVSTSFTIVAATECDALTRFEELKDWLKTLSERGHRGTRCLFGLGATARGPYRIEPQEAPTTNDPEGNRKWELFATFQIAANGPQQAWERFGGYADWVNQLKARGHTSLEHLALSGVGAVHNVEFSHSESVPESLFDLFPSLNAWTDAGDLGECTERDVNAVFRFDACDSIILRTNEHNEAIAALEFVAELMSRVNQNLYLWKWIVIALHNAVQAYMVLALKGTSPARVVRKDQGKRLALAEAAQRNVSSGFQAQEHESVNVDHLLDTPLETDATEPSFDELQLDKFLNLYKKIKNGHQMGMFTNSRPFKPKGTQTASINELNRIRNNFIHFIPHTRGIDARDLAQITTNCVEVIWFLAFESNNISFSYDEKLSERTEAYLISIKRAVLELGLGYDARLADPYPPSSTARG